MKYRQPFKGDYPISLDYNAIYPPIYTEKNRHKGIDYACPSGTPILAAADGVIYYTGFEKDGYGNYIIILHQDISGTLYAHLSQIMVKKGSLVKAGEIIGVSGSTGNSTGPHLHFEARSEASKRSTTFDPKLKLQSVFDKEPDNTEPAPAYHPKLNGYVQVVCDVANVRCSLNPVHIVDQKKKGYKLTLEPETIIYNNLPYRKFYDPDSKCYLLIAEYDSFGTQILDYT